MARKKGTTRRTTTGKKKQERSTIPPEVAGTILLILSGITLVSLITPNHGGFVAAWLNFLFFMVGWGQYVIWLPLFLLAVWFFKRYGAEDADEKWEKPIGTFMLLGLLLIVFYLVEPGESLSQPGGGGIIGWVCGQLLRSALGTAGTVVLLVGLFPLAVILISGLSLRELYQTIRDLYYRFQDWRHFRQLTINQPTTPFRQPETKSRPFGRILSPSGSKAAPENGEAAVPISVVGDVEGQAAGAASSPVGGPGGPMAGHEVGGHQWHLPVASQIFEEGHEHEISEAEIRQRVKIIEETLLSFGVEARVREINQGPAVTQFSLEPGYMATKDAKGNPRKVRVSRIVNLSNDLALALAAAPIRIEAPIPGRPYVGLEVPNSITNLVTLRNLIESDRFHRVRGPLKLALGQDVSGHPVIVDLTSMPHLLIAGATGSGKSVCINAIVACLLTTHTPETLRLLMIDPKMVELVNYNGIPHLLAPVVTELEKVVGVLSWAVREMDRRYKLFAKEGVRNIVGYNEKMTSEAREVLPYIVLIVDELADLMMMAPDEVERTITRIAQMARATGMHLIIATQRPSVDVVTGLIKANFPARIAFAVTSQIDSRVIIDMPGAERLLGKGDMLYMAPDSAKLRRLQGVFVSDQELNRLTSFWRGSLPPSERKPRALQDDPRDLVQQPLWAEYREIEKAMARRDEDELLEKAIAVVREQGRASVSLLQRRMRIGYARAARLIDEMEDQGIIGPDEGGGRARPILVSQADDEADPTQDEESGV
ncbi:MAG: DNA translocase FtsK 4TM domain-containing protein [Anaerolineae bacterium]|nr:DNA translocase FtsK 4TM domain-containing protein [Anaerolineae bacterium]